MDADAPPLNRRDDMLSLLSTRRSVVADKLTDPGPSEAELEQILTAATRVPDHGKLAPWRFVLFTGDVNEKVKQAGAVVSSYLAEIIRYLTFNTDTKPFPFDGELPKS